MHPPSIPKKLRLARLIRRLVPAAVVLTAVGAVATLAVVLPARSPEAQPTQPPPVNVKVEVIHLEPNLPDAFELSGTVAPHRIVRVSAEVAGRVERCADGASGPLEEGQSVEANAPILFLNSELLQAEFDQSKAKLEYDRKELARFEEAAQRGVASPAELDGARTSLAVSQAAYGAAKARLERAVVFAPVSGILNKLPAEVGEYVKPGDPVAEIVQCDRVKVVVQVPERDIHYLAVGQRHDVLDAPRGGVLADGEVTYIDALADAAARTTRVELSVRNPARRLRDGQLVTVRLTRRVLHGAITIPLAAVVPQERGYDVFVNAGGGAERRSVALGFFTGERVLVTSGLKAGDRLIVDGHRFVSPGQAVVEREANEVLP